MALTRDPASAWFCALRIGRLNSQGQVPAGATNSVVTANVSKLTVKWDLEAGSEIVVKDGCGGVPFTAKTRDIPKRLLFDLDILTPNPAIHEMLLGQPLKTMPSGYGSRTVNDGVTTNGSPTFTSATAAFVAADIGATITATGIPASTVIVSVTNGTTVVMSANATGSGSALSSTIARPLPAGLTTGDPIGSSLQRLSVQPSDYGVSLEGWTKAIVAAGQAQQLPWIRWGFFQTFWAPSDRTLDANPMSVTFTGWGIENPGFGSGPGRDWLGGVTGVSPVAAGESFFDFAPPAASPGYTPVVGAPT